MMIKTFIFKVLFKYQFLIIPTILISFDLRTTKEVSISVTFIFLTFSTLCLKGEWAKPFGYQSLAG